jgi:hypothetical protein
VVFQVRGVFANVQTNEHVITRTSFGGDVDDDEQNDTRRLTEDVVTRQLVMNETVTFPRPPGLRRLTDNVVQRQHTMNENTTPIQLIQENHKTSLPNTVDKNSIKPAENIKTQDMQPKTSIRPNSTPITTDGDRLMST